MTALRLSMRSSGRSHLARLLLSRSSSAASCSLKMTEFTPPSEDAGVYLADPDMKNRLIWTTLHHVDKLGRLDPATGTWTEFPLMYAETDVRRLEVDPN